MQALLLFLLIDVKIKLWQPKFKYRLESSKNFIAGAVNITPKAKIINYSEISEIWQVISFIINYSFLICSLIN